MFVFDCFFSSTFVVHLFFLFASLYSPFSLLSFESFAEFANLLISFLLRRAPVIVAFAYPYDPSVAEAVSSADPEVGSIFVAPVLIDSAAVPSCYLASFALAETAETAYLVSVVAVFAVIPVAAAVSSTAAVVFHLVRCSYSQFEFVPSSLSSCFVVVF